VGSGSFNNNFQLVNAVKLNAKGQYYVMAVDHSGDTRGDDWTSRLTMLAVDAEVPLDVVPRAIVQPYVLPAIRRN
jgi:hypothetical protein